MNDFNAQKARELANIFDDTELNTILTLIKTRAEKRENNLIVYHPLSRPIIEELKKRGFTMEKIPTELVDVHHIISW